MKLRIRELREDRDLKQQQVAKDMLCDQSLYSKYERGERALPLELADRLANYFGTSVDYLLGRTDEKTPYPKSNRKKTRPRKRSFQLVEKVFSTSCLRFQNFQKVLKSIDLNGAGHPSWVPRAHPSFPFPYISGFIDSLKRPRKRSFFHVRRMYFERIRPFSGGPSGPGTPGSRRRRQSASPGRAGPGPGSPGSRWAAPRQNRYGTAS